MKLKNIPADIKSKSIKEAQNEIKDIIAKLEHDETDLEQSKNQYSRMMLLNYHIQQQYKKKLKEIKSFKYSKKNKKQSKVKNF
tara:strand:- start:234 stop:482 length:249 start_codon:yes stop_codon:yes gene_type:complete